MILDGAGAISSLRTVVFEAGPDYVYKRVEAYGLGGACVNFHNGEPSCIVGKVFSLLGLTAEKAEEFNVAGMAIASTSCERLNRSDFEWKFSNAAIGVLVTAQDCQDGGMSWGQALKAAEDRYAKYGETV